MLFTLNIWYVSPITTGGVPENTVTEHVPVAVAAPVFITTVTVAVPEDTAVIDPVVLFTVTTFVLLLDQ